MIATRISGDANPDNNGLFFFHSDHLGSNRLLTNSSGIAVVGSTIRYYPFGHWRTVPTADLTDRGFTGHLHDMNVGLIYMNARWYSAGVARFLSPDTIVPNPANPQSFNRYSYVLNRPLSFTDPTGHKECDLFCQQQNEMTTYELPFGSSWEGDWDIQQQQENREQAEAVARTGAELVCGVYDPCDIAYTGYRAVTGQAGTLETAAIAAPFVPGIIGRWGDNALGFVGRHLDEAAALFRRCSFSADTLVMTENGLVPISEVTLWTLVLAYNEETGEIGYYPVVAIWSHEDPVIVFLTIDGETIVTTPNHPFFTIEGEWEQAANLQPGDEIRDAAWGTGTVEAITFIANPQTMYNFTVAAAHTYFVGEGQWLVHNSCPFDDLANVRRGLGLPAAGSQNDVYTLARLDINGQSFYGINAHGQPTTLNRVNPITQTHAEADAVQQAINAGLGGQGGQVTMYVDRAPCDACGRNNGIGSLARNLGVNQIEVIWPGGSQIFSPTQ